MIRSIRVVLTRRLLGVLDSRGIRVHTVAEQTRISLVDLHRLVEFASPLDHRDAGRLIEWGMKTVIVSQPKTRARSKPAVHYTRLGNERSRAPVSLA
jgi:hypothetical protein